MFSSETLHIVFLRFQKLFRDKKELHAIIESLSTDFEIFFYIQAMVEDTSGSLYLNDESATA
jgi:hypothetical protein